MEGHVGVLVGDVADGSAYIVLYQLVQMAHMWI